MAYPFLSPGARLLAVKLKDIDGSPLGEVKEWMMDIDEGRVVFVLATFENMVGEYVAVPWEQMKADKENGGYQVRAHREQLMNGPRVSTEEVKDLITDHAFLDRLFQHYGARPYWQGSEAPPTTQPSGTTDTTLASVAASQDNPIRKEGQSQTNDLKEIRDEYAAQDGDEQEGRTHEEHGEGSGYGG